VPCLPPTCCPQVPLSQLAGTEEVQVRAWDDTMNTPAGEVSGPVGSKPVRAAYEEDLFGTGWDLSLGVHYDAVMEAF